MPDFVPSPRPQETAEPSLRSGRPPAAMSAEFFPIPGLVEPPAVTAVDVDALLQPHFGDTWSGREGWQHHAASRLVQLFAFETREALLKWPAPGAEVSLDEVIAHIAALRSRGKKPQGDFYKAVLYNAGYFATQALPRSDALRQQWYRKIITDADACLLRLARGGLRETEGRQQARIFRRAAQGSIHDQFLELHVEALGLSVSAGLRRAAETPDASVRESEYARAWLVIYELASFALVRHNPPALAAAAKCIDSYQNQVNAEFALRFGSALGKGAIAEARYILDQEEEQWRRLTAHFPLLESQQSRQRLAQKIAARNVEKLPEELRGELVLMTLDAVAGLEQIILYHRTILNLHEEFETSTASAADSLAEMVRALSPLAEVLAAQEEEPSMPAWEGLGTYLEHFLRLERCADPDARGLYRLACARAKAAQPQYGEPRVRLLLLLGDIRAFPAAPQVLDEVMWQLVSATIASCVTHLLQLSRVNQETMVIEGISALSGVDAAETEGLIAAADALDLEVPDRPLREFAARSRKFNVAFEEDALRSVPELGRLRAALEGETDPGRRREMEQRIAECERRVIELMSSYAGSALGQDEPPGEEDQPPLDSGGRQLLSDVQQCVRCWPRTTSGSRDRIESLLQLRQAIRGHLTGAVQTALEKVEECLAAQTDAAAPAPLRARLNELAGQLPEIELTLRELELGYAKRNPRLEKIRARLDKAWESVRFFNLPVERPA